MSSSHSGKLPVCKWQPGAGGAEGLEHLAAEPETLGLTLPQLGH